jgi:hypothetical protein
MSNKFKFLNYFRDIFFEMQKITVQEKIDRIFKEIGEFGPYQLLIILICGSTSIVPGMIAYSDEFVKSDPDHRY